MKSVHLPLVLWLLVIPALGFGQLEPADEPTTALNQTTRISHEPLRLPVDWALFEGTKSGGRIHLHWQTHLEIDNEGFEIQRSKDAVYWEVLDWLPGQGTVFNSTDYYYQDNRPHYGWNYYRLRQVDYDGDYTFSTSIALRFKNPVLQLQLFPNPVVEDLEYVLPITDFEEDAFQVELYATEGALLWSQQQEAQSRGVIPVYQLAPGPYLLLITTLQGTFSGRFVKSN